MPRSRDWYRAASPRWWRRIRCCGALLTTRAITVGTPPGRIWPWLVQMGSGRGGAYTYDWIENLFGLNMHRADEILPQFQDLHVGDVLPVAEGGPKLLVVLRSDDGRWVWAFVLHEVPSGTRLISRNRIAVPDASLLVRWFNQRSSPARSAPTRASTGAGESACAGTSPRRKAPPSHRKPRPTAGRR